MQAHLMQDRYVKREGQGHVALSSGRVLRIATAGGNAIAADSAGFFAETLSNRQPPQPTTPDLRFCKLTALLTSST